MSQHSHGKFGRREHGVDRHAEEGRLKAALESVGWHGGVMMAGQAAIHKRPLRRPERNRSIAARIALDRLASLK
jgi:hypothetical protein